MNTVSTILITGGTGLIGKALAEALLQKGHFVIILTRSIPVNKINIRDNKFSYALWNLKEKKIDNDAFSKADYIIHLAGASVAEKRWTKKRKQEIINSRVESGKLIVESLKTVPNKVKAVISVSGIGWYGPDSINNRNPFTEEAIFYNDFLGNTCKEWEGAIESVSSFGKRLVIFRTGIVLSKEGGALKEFIRPLKFRLATILGNGKQIISWIHIDDMVRMFLYAMDNEKISGTFNAVAPNPVTNKQLLIQLAEKERGKYFIPVHVPSFVLKLMLGEMSVEILKSTTVSAEKVQQNGFIFQYPSIETAITQLTGS